MLALRVNSSVVCHRIHYMVPTITVDTFAHYHSHTFTLAHIHITPLQHFWNFMLMTQWKDIDYKLVHQLFDEIDIKICRLSTCLYISNRVVQYRCLYSCSEQHYNWITVTVRILIEPWYIVWHKYIVTSFTFNLQHSLV